MLCISFTVLSRDTRDTHTTYCAIFFIGSNVRHWAHDVVSWFADYCGIVRWVNCDHCSCVCRVIPGLFAGGIDRSFLSLVSYLELGFSDHLFHRVERQNGFTNRQEWYDHGLPVPKHLFIKNKPKRTFNVNLYFCYVNNSSKETYKLWNYDEKKLAYIFFGAVYNLLVCFKP